MSRGDMPLYSGSKQLHAKPMTLGDYNAYRGWQQPAGEDPAAQGYLVEYVDGGKPNDERHEGYISWSPADVFERAYGKIESHVDRMAAELRELGERIKKLYAFIMGPGPYEDLADDEKLLLNAQGAAMMAYEGVLTMRLNKAIRPE